jgi:hypothetical protein
VRLLANEKNNVGVVGWNNNTQSEASTAGSILSSSRLCHRRSQQFCTAARGPPHPSVPRGHNMTTTVHRHHQRVNGREETLKDLLQHEKLVGAHTQSIINMTFRNKEVGRATNYVHIICSKIYIYILIHYITFYYIFSVIEIFNFVTKIKHILVVSTSPLKPLSQSALARGA